MVEAAGRLFSISVFLSEGTTEGTLGILASLSTSHESSIDLISKGTITESTLAHDGTLVSAEWEELGVSHSGKNCKNDSGLHVELFRKTPDKRV